MVLTPLAAILSIAFIFGGLLGVSGIVTWPAALTWVGQVGGLTRPVEEDHPQRDEEHRRAHHLQRHLRPPRPAPDRIGSDLIG